MITVIRGGDEGGGKSRGESSFRYVGGRENYWNSRSDSFSFLGFASMSSFCSGRLECIFVYDRLFCD